MDPKLTNKKGANKGKNIRECIDTDEHPTSTPIAVFFDVTGSMGHIPVVLQEKLPALLGLLQRKGYVEDPQIMFGAIGDAFSDRIPLQVGQFESDNTMDENLENIVLEGGGGGSNHESYELGAYFLARHTYIDSFEKRDKKGYAFFIGDERLYAAINRGNVSKIIGDNLEENLTSEQIFAELQEKYDVYFLFAAEGMYEPEEVLPDGAKTRYGDYGAMAIGWRKVLGEKALVLEDATAVCETIALALGVAEGTISFEDGLADLEEVGSDSKAIKAAGKALATVGAGSSVIVSADGELPEVRDEAATGAERL